MLLLLAWLFLVARWLGIEQRGEGEGHGCDWGAIYTRGRMAVVDADEGYLTEVSSGGCRPADRPATVTS